jgi:hypothetical protein
MFKIFHDLTTEQIICYRGPKGEVRNWYHEEYNAKEKLVITVGDSWTWGDHLGKIDWHEFHDDPIRLKSIYGKKLSNKLDADWVLIARPGCSNYWMLDQLKFFSSIIQELKQQYKEIIIVVTLTEDLRECDFVEEREYFNEYNNILANSSNLENFLIHVEKVLFLEYKKLFDTLGATCKITRAFTDVWPNNRTCLGNYLLDKTWCDVFQDLIQFDRYHKVVPFMGQAAIAPLTEKLISNLNTVHAMTIKQDLINLEEKLNARWNFLGDSVYNLKGSTYHPNVEGHDVYSNYLYQTLIGNDRTL